MRSSEVGSAQCRSSKASATGCERAPARTQAVDCGQLPASQLLRREARCTVLGQRDVYQRREQWCIFTRVQADEPQSVLEIGQAAFGRLARSESLAAPFSDGVHRRILQQLR